jgi:glutathione peroxidase
MFGALWMLLTSALAASVAAAGPGDDGQRMPRMEFSNLDGGVHDSASWAGKPVLIINSASLCGYTDQYATMQKMHEQLGPRGLIVLAVPSNDFNQELATGAEVKDFCELTYTATLPMTDLTKVRGADAHPFYLWMARTHGFVPNWNFNKVLIGADGQVKGSWGSRTRPDAAKIMNLITPDLEG